MTKKKQPHQLKHPKSARPEVRFCACMEHAFAAVDEKVGDRLHVAMVSPADSDLLAAYAWRAYCPHAKIARDPRKKVFYLRRDSRKDGTPKTVLLHREITGAKGRTAIVDHENHNGLDCRRPNLRPCTHAQNRGNSRKPHNNTSGFKGVHTHPSGRWAARIGSGSRNYIGLYDTPEEAARAYDAKAVERWGVLALLNFPQELAA